MGRWCDCRSNSLSLWERVGERAYRNQRTLRPSFPALLQREKGAKDTEGCQKLPRNSFFKTGGFGWLFPPCTEAFAGWNT